MGQIKEHPSRLSKELAEELLRLSSAKNDGYKTMIGKTMCTNDFYEGKWGIWPSGQRGALAFQSSQVRIPVVAVN
jgi:hypothetical protein